MALIKKYQSILKLLILLVFAGICLGNPYMTLIGVQALVNAIAAIGLVMISGLTRQIHLGQAAFIGIGAYVSAIMMTKLGVSFWVTVPCAIVVSALIGVVLGIPTLKLSGGPYLAMVTQIFGEIIYVVLLNWESVTGGSFGIARIPAPEIGSVSFKTKPMLLVLTVVLFILAYFVADRIIKSKYGRFFISVRESEAAAQSVGVNTMKCKIIAFTLSSAYAGLAGVLYAQYIGYLNPEQFRWQISLTLISMVIIGGIANIDGGILGAVVLTVLPELLRGFDAQLRMIVYGVLVILVLAFLPDGLISLIGKKPSEIKLMLKSRAGVLQNKRRKKPSIRV